jgi:Rieske Fe-S protein
MAIDCKTELDKVNLFNSCGNIGKICDWETYPGEWSESGTIVGPAFVMTGQNLEIAVVPVEKYTGGVVAVAIDGLWYLTNKQITMNNESKITLKPIEEYLDNDASEGVEGPNLRFGETAHKFVGNWDNFDGWEFLPQIEKTCNRCAMTEYLYIDDVCVHCGCEIDWDQEKIEFLYGEKADGNKARFVISRGR